MILSEVIYSVAKNKCPRCHRGNVFQNVNPYNFKNGLTMSGSCSACHLKYDKEPGFFYGSMYVSYALMAAVLIIWFIADLLFFHLDAIKLAVFVVSTMVLLFPMIFRWARLFWINFFFRFDKKYAIKNSVIADFSE